VDRPLTGIAYRWALDETGRPLPIEAAQRGRRYVCPLCRGQMIARLGDQLQHHFGHENDTGCTPEAVTRAAVSRWIAIQLREALTARQVVKVTWHCSRCGQTHTADVLEAVSQIAEGYQWESFFADIALVDAGGNVRGVVLVQDEEVPTSDVLRFFADQEIFTIMIPASVTPSGSNIQTLIAEGQLAGGPCPVLQKATNIIQDAEEIRQTLRDTVARWPGYFYGPLETVDGLANVVRIGNRALWLPGERWREIIGGTRNPLAPGIQILVQTWPHTDGGVIWLYYATVRDTAAVGVRRYGPGQTPTAYIDARFRNRHATAFDLVRYFVTQ
jgi:Competence protein CoiA-like family